MSEEFPWSHYDKAYKAIHDKLNEILSKLDNPTDPTIQDIVDRIDRALGKPYGNLGLPFKQHGEGELYVINEELWELLWSQDFEVGLGAFVKDGGSGDIVEREETWLLKTMDGVSQIFRNGSSTSYDGGYSCRIYADNLTPFYCFAWAGFAAKSGIHRNYFHFGKFTATGWGALEYMRFDTEFVDAIGVTRLARVYYFPETKRIAIKTKTVDQDVIATLTYGLEPGVWHELIVEYDLSTQKYIKLLLDGAEYDISTKSLYYANTSYKMSGLYKVGLSNNSSLTPKEMYFDDCRVYHKIRT